MEKTQKTKKPVDGSAYFQNIYSKFFNLLKDGFDKNDVKAYEGTYKEFKAQKKLIGNLNV